MESISKDKFALICEQLNALEKERNIKILYAVESGSRGWGFSNEDSDYDIRFVFKRPVNDYLTINRIKDTIDYMDGDFDYVGWDIKKTLYLHWKSNPNLREWMKQEIVYQGDCKFLNNLPEFSPATLKYHYGSLAYNNWTRYVKNQKDEMTRKVTKTYLYVIRCILTWILLDDGIDPPINIYEIMNHFADDDRIGKRLYSDILMLISYYKSNCMENEPDERGIGNITTFIETYMKILKADKPKKENQPDIEIYNKRFRDIILQNTTIS